MFHLLTLKSVVMLADSLMKWYHKGAQITINPKASEGVVNRCSFFYTWTSYTSKILSW